MTSTMRQSRLGFDFAASAWRVEGKARSSWTSSAARRVSSPAR
jgi:hypothetical protein